MPVPGPAPTGTPSPSPGGNGGAPESEPQRIGILGGTFDPPHVGHMRLARAAWREIGLDSILFVPAGHPPHKTEQEITPVPHRLAMLAIALRPYSCFHIDRSDIDRPPPHFTADLLPLIHAQHPAADLWLVIGGDSLRDLLTWDRPDEIVNGCRLAVLPRPGVTIKWEMLEAELPGIRDRVDMLSADPLQVSSTTIRRRLGENRPVGNLLHPAVADYIARHRLYATS